MQVVAFGECMIEVARRPGGQAKLGFGGDTLNAALYLARLGVDCGYMTAIGVDPWSEEMRAAWVEEGIDDSLVLRHPTRNAGLYAITLDARGERSFTYWRDTSAARAFFACEGAEQAMARAWSARALYLSGITLALYTPGERRRIVALAQDVRDNGGMVVFDPNFRAKLWPDVEAFRTAVCDLAPAISIVLPSFDDEALVWGDGHAEISLRRWRDLGVEEVCVKSGARGALCESGWVHRPAVLRPVDTTGAGDSFNAGYISARLRGADPARAAAKGAALASVVIGHPGAIIPRAAMPDLTDEAA